MNKLLAAGLGLALISAPLAASAQDYRHDRSDRHGPRFEDRRHGHGYGPRHRDYAYTSYHRHARCFFRNEAFRDRHGRLHYRQVEVCRR